MTDETTAPARYPGRDGRILPLVLGLGGLAALPVVFGASGPFLWPWGAGVLVLLAGGVVAAAMRWRSARESVHWAEDRWELRRGWEVVRIDLGALTRVDNQPCAARTRLTSGRLNRTLSHRLVGIEDLLDGLRQRRPDLFPEPGDRLTLTRSALPAVFQVLLAAASAGAGWILAGWQPWLGLFFAAAGGYSLLRVFWFIPRGYVVQAGALTVLYGWRSKTWRHPRAVHEDSYAAAGAVFFRMRFDFGRWSVTLDEGQLRQPLRPRARWILAALTAEEV